MSNESKLQQQVEQLQQEVKQLRQHLSEVRLSQDYTENLLQTANAIIVILDGNGYIKEFSKTAEQITGYTRKELSGKNWFETLVPRERYPEVWLEFDRLTAGGFPTTFENPILTKAGEERHIVWQNSNIIQNDQIVGVISFGLDITERKRAEELLRDSERRSRAWLEHSPVCTKIVDLDFNLQYMSSAGVESLHIDDITAYYGKPYPFEFYPQQFRDRMTENLERVVKTGEVVTQEAFVLDLDGAETWFHSTLVPVNDNEGRIDYLIVVSIDITERKQTEGELQSLTQRLRTSIEEMPIAYILWDEKFRVIEWNPCAEQLFGYSKNEMLGKNAADYIVPKLARPMVSQVIGQLLAGERASYSQTGNNITKDGTEISCHWYNSPLKDQTGITTSVLSMVVDVTENQQLTEKLEQHRHDLQELVERRTMQLAEARSRAEKASDALREKERLLTQAARISKLGHARWDEDKLEYISVSEEYASIFGYKAEEFLKRFKTA